MHLEDPQSAALAEVGTNWVDFPSSGLSFHSLDRAQTIVDSGVSKSFSQSSSLTLYQLDRTRLSLLQAAKHLLRGAFRTGS